MKRKIKKKVLTSFVTSLLTVAIALSIPMTMQAFADAQSCGNGVTWTLSGGVLTISGKGAMTDWSFRSPAPWDSRRDSIRTLKIEDGVTSVGREAFYLCTSLTSVTIPDSVQSIGDHAFFLCTRLTSVTLPKGLTSIGEGAFCRCTSLGDLTIPNSVRSIGKNAFSDCYGFTKIDLPDSVTSVGDGAFAYCTGLTRVSVANSKTVIGGTAFTGCRNLTVSGASGSSAQKIAKENKIPFAANGASPESEAPTQNAAGAVSVTLPDFAVSLNGQKNNNEYSKYPLLVYKDITYFPMTYYDCRLLGLTTEWSAQDGLAIAKTGEKLSEYVHDSQSLPNAKTLSASIASGKIRVNGKIINNGKEEYPLLLFRDVTYFPLTWRFAVEEFGWSYHFDAANGLVITSN